MNQAALISQGSALNGLRLLVVEDETMIAMMLEAMLDTMGCTVVDVAGTLAKGLRLAGDESLRLDGAILDVNLGGEAVYPVAERLAQRGVPFIFCTGYGLAGLASNFAHVPTLTKPYDQDDLEDLLLRVLVNSQGR